MNFIKKSEEIIYLPSDSSNAYYPSNTTSNYITKLSENINFNSDYEVALLELIYPNSVQNMPEDGYIILKALKDSQIIPIKTFVLKKGIYSEEKLLKKIQQHLENINEEKVIKALNIGLKKNTSYKSIDLRSLERPSVIKNKITDKIDYKSGKILSTIDNVDETIVLFIEFDNNLFKILGFTDDQNTRGNMSANNIIDIYGQIHIIYIYCDIVSPVMVGNTRVPLIQVITRDHPNIEYNMLGKEHRIAFQSPIYLPVSRKSFDSISINLRDDIGHFISFESGKVLATLHFRKI
jgi:hypothetical protein